MLSDRHIVVEESWPTPLQLQSTNVCGHLFMHSSLKNPPQHFNQVEVWTLTGPSQYLDSFLFSDVENKPKSSPLPCLTVGVRGLFFTKCRALNDDQTSPLWSHLSKGRCSYQKMLFSENRVFSCNPAKHTILGRV